MTTISKNKRIAYDYLEDRGISGNNEVYEWAEDVVEEVALAKSDATLAETSVSDETLDEIVASAVPIYTADRLRIVAASNTLAAWDKEVNTKNGVASTSASDVCEAVLLEVAYELVHYAANELGVEVGD